MSTKINWIVPCYFNYKEYSNDEIVFDLTKHLQLFLKNEVWNRKFDYGFNNGLKNTDIEDIKNVKIKIKPRSISNVYPKRIIDYIERFQKIPKYLDLENYKKWDSNLGVVIIEVEYYNNSNEIPTRKEVIDFEYREDFYKNYHKHVAVLKELASFFLASLHLTFPTKSIMGWNDDPIDDGIFCIKSNKKFYATHLRTNSFMHHILIEKDKIQNVIENMDALASVWHLNLWPLKRFLISVESNRVSMDNLLDLLYSLEGLFSKNTSSDYIKMFCTITLCKEKKQAIHLKEWLDKAFQIRNDIAHGERSYDSFDKIKFLGKEIAVEQVYWEMKKIVVLMLIRAISKLLKDNKIKNLKFNHEDLLNVVFK